MRTGETEQTSSAGRADINHQGHEEERELFATVSHSIKCRNESKSFTE